MRFTLAQLRKLKMPYSYDESLDLSEELNGFEDIISSKPCLVSTKVKERGLDTYLFSFNIKIEIIMLDSISLNEIPVTIETDAEEIFTTDDSIIDAFLIDGITLDTKEAILMNILINKPMSITEEEYDEEYIEEDDKDDSINPAFASLKDLL